MTVVRICWSAMWHGLLFSVSGSASQGIKESATGKSFGPVSLCWSETPVEASCDVLLFWVWCYWTKTPVLGKLTPELVQSSFNYSLHAFWNPLFLECIQNQHFTSFSPHACNFSSQFITPFGDCKFWNLWSSKIYVLGCDILAKWLKFSMPDKFGFPTSYLSLGLE